MNEAGPGPWVTSGTGARGAALPLPHPAVPSVLMEVEGKWWTPGNGFADRGLVTVDFGAGQAGNRQETFHLCMEEVAWPAITAAQLLLCSWGRFRCWLWSS